MKIFLTSCISLDYDLCLLDSFLNHYKNIGIDCKNFLLVLNCFKDKKNIDKGLSILNKHNITNFEIWEGEYRSDYKWNKVNSILTKNTSNSDWIIHPDADEFFELYNANLKKVLSDFDSKSINAFQGVLVDRLAKGNQVPDKNFPIIDPMKDFPIKCYLSRMIGLGGIKLMGYKAYLRANRGSGQIHPNYEKLVNYPYGKSGLHLQKNFIKDFGSWLPQGGGKCISLEKNFPEIINRYKFVIHHFKWHGHLLNKLNQRIETYSKLKVPHLDQSRRILDHYNKNQCFKLY